MIPFLDLTLSHKYIEKEIQQALKKVLKNNNFILGEETSVFEKKFARYCGAKYCVGVNSGTDALFLALKCLGIGKGDEVIVPTFTYIASAFAINYTGARPVFVDIDDSTFNIDTNKVKRAITKKTKAIIPVHLFGHPADMNPLLKLARSQKIHIIEDAAQAHGATYMPLGKKCGSIGDIGCFSFYPSKNIGALGDAGAITTNNPKIYKKLLMLRDYGRINKYNHKIIGYNSRLDTLQASVLIKKLKYLDLWNRLRSNSAKIYSDYLKVMPDVKIPVQMKYAKRIFHVYSIQLKRRDRALRILKRKGVNCLIHYPIPLHLQDAYKDLGYKKGDFPVAEKVAKQILSLPIFPYITKKQIKYVINSLKEALGHANTR